MKLKIYNKFFLGSILFLLLVFIDLNCGIEDFIEPDTLYPPFNLVAYPHNEYITIIFNSINNETKFDGFNVYISKSSSIKSSSILPLKNEGSLPTISRSVNNSDGIVKIEFDIKYFDDIQKIENGVTYYISVRSHNVDNFESEYSEEVSTTPRNESSEPVVLYADSGFSLQNGNNSLPFDFTVKTQNNDLSLFSDDYMLKDEGYYEYDYLYNKVDNSGFIDKQTYIQIFENHIYILKTTNNRFGKVYILQKGKDYIKFNWAFQSLSDNLDI